MFFVALDCFASLAMTPFSAKPVPQYYGSRCCDVLRLWPRALSSYDSLIFPQGLSRLAVDWAESHFLRSLPLSPSQRNNVALVNLAVFLEADSRRKGHGCGAGGCRFGWGLMDDKTPRCGMVSRIDFYILWISCRSIHRFFSNNRLSISGLPGRARRFLPSCVFPQDRAVGSTLLERLRAVPVSRNAQR